MTRSHVNVVMATYNRAGLLPRSVASALAQRGVDLTVTVVDDGSTDETLEILNGIADRRLRVISQENRERGAARNRGVQAVESELVAFMDSDDEWRPGHLSALVAAADANPEASLLHARAELVGPTGQVLGTLPSEGRTSVDHASLQDRNDIALSSAMVRRRRFINVGGFLELRSHQRAEDWELWLRLAELGPVVSLDRPTCIVHFHAGNSVADGERNAQALRRTMEHVVQEHPNVHAETIRAGFTRAMARSWIDVGNRQRAAAEVLRTLRQHPRVVRAKGFWKAVAITVVAVPTARRRRPRARHG